MGRVEIRRFHCLNIDWVAFIKIICKLLKITMQLRSNMLPAHSANPQEVYTVDLQRAIENEAWVFLCPPCTHLNYVGASRKKMLMIFQLKSHLYLWIPRKLDQTRSALVFYLCYHLNYSEYNVACYGNMNNQKINWTSWLGLFLRWNYNLESRDHVLNLSYSRVHSMIQETLLLTKWMDFHVCGASCWIEP